MKRAPDLSKPKRIPLIQHQKNNAQQRVQRRSNRLDPLQDGQNTGHQGPKEARYERTGELHLVILVSLSPNEVSAQGISRVSAPTSSSRTLFRLSSNGLTISSSSGTRSRRRSKLRQAAKRPPSARCSARSCEKPARAQTLHTSRCTTTLFDATTCPGNTLVRLYDPNGNALGFDDDDGVAGGCSLIDPVVDAFAANLAAGTYSIRVEEQGNDATIGPYQLLVEVF